jgi:hypothetical protein
MGQRVNEVFCKRWNSLAAFSTSRLITETKETFMGRTLPSITQAFLQEQQSLAKFRRALRLEDQRALDDILAASRQHLAAAAYASHLLPFEIMLLAMLVEEHKEVMRLRSHIEVLLAEREKTKGQGTGRDQDQDMEA